MRRAVVRMLFVMAIVSPIGRAGAQDQAPALIEQLAAVLAVEDARNFDDTLFRRGLAAPEQGVRRTTALAVGRVGDARGTPLLLPLLRDADATVSTAAAFGLGLLRDSAATRPLIARVTDTPALDTLTAAEVVTALAKIGDQAAADFFGNALRDSTVLPPEHRTATLRRMVLEAWRLRRLAPIEALLPFTADTSSVVRARAVYALGRLQAPAAAPRLLVALGDSDPYIRSLAARALTRTYTDKANLGRSVVVERLAPLVDDTDAAVRINALGALATSGDTRIVPKVVPRLDDSMINVQVQAAATLGELGGPEAVAGLQHALRDDAPFAVRRAALLGLARADSAAFRTAAERWQSSAEWWNRAAAAEAWPGAGASGAPPFGADPDGRVIAAGLQAWLATVEGPDSGLIATARPLLAHADPAVRKAAADAVARAADPGDLPALAALYRQATADSLPRVALAALNALLAIRGSGPAAQRRVDDEFLQATARPAEYQVRRWAVANWPEAAARWGAIHPIATGRNRDEYRAIVQRYMLAPDSLAHPHVVIHTEGRGAVEVELFGPDAPLTVANFLKLVDRRFFQGNRWHRVVPNFVVQDGDARGDGFGIAGGAIRDEINLHHYDAPVLGMALSGPDTGTTQWFINLSPQPHLDGTYTVFGRVVGGVDELKRIVQGDSLRVVRR